LDSRGPSTDLAFVPFRLVLHLPSDKYCAMDLAETG